jgi:hypothetical protein
VQQLSWLYRRVTSYWDLWGNLSESDKQKMRTEGLWWVGGRKKNKTKNLQCTSWNQIEFLVPYQIESAVDVYASDKRAGEQYECASYTGLVPRMRYRATFFFCLFSLIKIKVSIFYTIKYYWIQNRLKLAACAHMKRPSCKRWVYSSALAWPKANRAPNAALLWRASSSL